MNEIRKLTGNFKSFDGTPIYFEVRGNGRPIVLAYGIGCLINHWTHQIRHFSHHFQTIVFDYRGHQNTPVPENRDMLTIDASARDIQGLMHHLGHEKASFWGHSYGVQVLIRAYDMFPDIFSNLVLINGFAANPIKGMFGVDTVSAGFQLLKDGYRNFPSTFTWFWRSAINNPLAIPISSFLGGFNTHLTNLKDIEVYAKGVAAMGIDVFITLFEQMMTYDGSPVLDRISIPTLIISGNNDGITPKDHQLKMHQRIRGSQLVNVPYGSHCTQLDLPEFVNLRIRKFLEEHGYS